jgi:phospholipase C
LSSKDLDRLNRSYSRGDRRRSGRARMLQRRRRSVAALLVVLLGGLVAFRLTRDEPAPAGALQRRGPEPVAGGSPNPSPTSGEAERIPIKHVVFIIKENRTFDNYFGRYPGAEGTREGKTSTGETVPLAVAKDSFEPDLGHAFLDGVKSINGGKMDGFDTVTNGETMNGYTSFTRKGMPNYWRYADKFVIGDHMFSSMYGPTFPEHLYTVAAQSGRVVGNKDPIGGEGGYCDDLEEQVIRFSKMSRKEKRSVMKAEEANDADTIVQYWERVKACFNFEVLPDHLEKKGIS